MFETIRAKVVRKEDLKRIREIHSGKKIVFCSGCYDILQSGHAVYFNQCKSYGDFLVVGVGRDHVISQLKGPGRPVNPENNRVYLVAALQDVDYAVLNDDMIEEGKIDYRTVIEALKPDILILNDDDSAIPEKTKLCKDNNISIQLVSRIVPPELEATSTTRIIDRIKFAYRAPLRIDFAGGWTDVPFIMEGKKGYVSNVAIYPLIEYKEGSFNFSGYPRGSGLSTSTAAKVLQLISSRNYNADAKTLKDIAEDLFNLENKELNWAIGRQDQYSIVYGGFNCFEFGDDYAKAITSDIPKDILEEFRKGLLLLHTGASRNAQSAVEQVYRNYNSPEGQAAIDKLARYGKEFAETLSKKKFVECAKIMEANFEAQKELASDTSNEYLESMYAFAKKNGAHGGKICGAGGGGAYVFYCEDPKLLAEKMKKQFVDCFEIDFGFHYEDVKKLNTV